MKQKFNAQDRDQVISEMSKRLGVRLRPINRRQKYLIDADSKRYLVLGGYGYWHAIPHAIIDAEVQKNDKAALFVAVRKVTRIDIYAGSVEPFVSFRDRLKRNKAGDYQFNLDERGENLYVKEIPEVRFSRFAVRDYSINQKEEGTDTYIKFKELKAEFLKFSDEEKAAFLVQLGLIPKNKKQAGY